MDWEIWFAKFYFEEDPTQFKERPVLIIPDGSCIKCVKITSQQKRSNNDYQVVKWQHAGLHKPSIARLDKQLVLLPSDLKHKIGKLHPVDVLQLKALFGQLSI